MGRILILFSFLLVMSAFTIQTFWRSLSGKSTIELINRLPLLFSPANYVYLCWLLIFASLVVWIVHCYKHRNSNSVTSLQTTLFAISSIFLISFFIAWHNGQNGIAIFLFVLQLLSLFGLYITYPLTTENIKIRIPIALFLSWSLFFFITFMSYIIVYFNWHGFGLSNALWAVILLTFGTAIALHLRYHHFDIVAPIIFIWGYVGIAIQNGLEELLVTTAALFLCGVLIAGILFVKKNRGY
ncbi:hypothetical protein [Solibacillus sp. CAU 1738]|uniref:hypothetical protein n=1 Tax=Solibacillus sp. CAU 1738 TaxID=3140363 RepID=UPI0032602B74